MRIFRPDIFSDPVPRSATVTEPVAATVRGVLRERYAACGEPLEIRQSGGLEINSRNHPVRTQKGHWLLKRLGNPRGLQTSQAQLEVVGRLAARGIPVPTPIRSDNGTLLVEHGGAWWCLLSFVEGRYFAGGLAELERTGRAIGALLAECARLPAEVVDLPEMRYDHDAQRTTIVLAVGRRDAWDGWFGDDAAALREAWDAIVAMAEITGRARGLRDRVQVVHVDLHPHNILMRDGRPAAFLDPDAILRQATGVAVAFAAFKLVRQAVVRSERSAHPSAADLGAAFLDAVESAYPLEVHRSDLALLAKVEVLRRIAIILDLNVREGDRSWNRILPMHLAGLNEIDMIFGAGVARSGRRRYRAMT